MRQAALHSAVLEVRLYYEKGWSRGRIAKFAFGLQRRRLRAIRARQRDTASGPMIPGLMAAFEIEPAVESTAVPIEANGETVAAG